ncbi:MAG: ATP-binding cassette domain-containing protein [Bryobacteraceae bacterium]
MDAVNISHVTKTFGEEVTAVDDLSLTIPQGAVYGFIGPNGSGKSTTMRMIVNIFYPDSGSIQVFGKERRGVGGDPIGYLPEERGLYRQMEVRTLLEFYGELRSGRSVKKEVNEWLKRLDLEKWGDKKVEALSKGMSQKVQFIATVVPEPKLLILDEPFSGLDPVSAQAIRDAVLEMKRRGTTIILSTHDMSVAGSLCDSIFMIFKGKKVLDGTLSAIQSQYGRDTIRVEVSGGVAAVQGIAGVEQVQDHGQFQDLRIGRECDPQAVLRTLLSRGAVNSFSIVQPSLHDIFVRIAGPEVADAA